NKKNVSYAVAKIINLLVVQDTWQKIAVASNLKKPKIIDYFCLGPDLSWKFKQHLHSFLRHSCSV
ncbi:MAG: hypothetical protein PVG43_04950, partial [Nitrosopumilaceae archaeon]